MGKIYFEVQVFFLVVLCLSGTTRGSPQKPSAFFVFGDSYADTGNQNHNSSCWKYPSGVTWPGYPAGRFGNGHLQTDFLADKLGLPSPTPYANIINQSIATGINFAIGGSGVTYAWGVLPLNAQVDQFELVLRTGAFSPWFLANSFTLVSNVGNDYAVKYADLEEYLLVVREVIEGMTVALQRLYNLGLRNIVVSNLPPVNCLPGQTIVSNYTTCESVFSPLILVHNKLLLDDVRKLNTLPDSNFLVLDELEVFTYILNNTELYGITEKLVPCCVPLTASDSCGDVDGEGNPRYTLCKDPSSHVFWDAVHPAESTWKHVVDLYYNETGFVIGATTLESWLHQNELRVPGPAHVPGPQVRLTGAAYQLQEAHKALISETDYSESLGLLEAVDWARTLDAIPDQRVTVFLPSNAAYYSQTTSTMDLLFGEDQFLPVVEFHVAKGFYDSDLLLGSIQNLTTLSGADLLVTPMSTAILVGPMNAMVVRPDLYQVKGQLVIHGIDKIMIPPAQ